MVFMVEEIAESITPLGLMAAVAGLLAAVCLVFLRLRERRQHQGSLVKKDAGVLSVTEADDAKNNVSSALDSTPNAGVSSPSGQESGTGVANMSSGADGTAFKTYTPPERGQTKDEDWSRPIRLVDESNSG